ncbi:MAG: hypothetical protein IT168_26205 [Bryobacterales bacterium]|nr:hypothetical protein [Bryobacterales bacterium]
MTRPILALCIGVLLLGGPLRSETTVRVLKAELAIPFGSAPGSLVLLEDYLTFVDQEKPEASFAARRDEIRAITVEGEAVAIEVASPVRDRSGARTRLTFKVADPAGPDAIKTWQSAASVSTPKATSSKQPSETLTYQVQHDHRFGGCKGRLIITQDRIAFESITDISHSRQWALRDVKEMKRDNPYALKIEPFSGNTYKFELQGQGMDSDTYRTLVDRVTAARSLR